MFKRIFIFLILICLGLHIVCLVLDAGVFWKPKNIGMSCQVIDGVDGAEDFAFSKKENLLFVSSAPRFSKEMNSGPNGTLYVLEPKTKNLKKVIKDELLDFHPHGIGLFENEDETILYVVNHKKNESVIEVFSWNNEFLVHQKTIRDAMVIVPNDIVPVDKDKFYLTLDHGSRNPFLMKLEAYTRLGQGKLLFYDGKNFKEIISGINFANGLAYDQKANKIYLASMLGKKILSYNLKADYSIDEGSSIKLDVAPDNITLTKNGDILVSGHAKLFELQAHASDHSRKSSFEILKVSNPSSKSTFKTLISNDGSLASGVSVAQEVGDEIFLGTIYQDHILYCI